jgi:uncharacterized protein YqjF (DUF2071 family)
MARFDGSYAAAGEAAPATAGTLEHFLTERYCMYSGDGDRLYRTEIHHAPWPLQPADVEVRLNTMPPPGVRLADGDPLAHYSERQDVVIWPREEIGDD